MSSSDDGGSHSPVNVDSFVGSFERPGKDSEDLVSDALRGDAEDQISDVLRGILMYAVDKSDEENKADLLRFHTKGVVPGKPSLILIDNEVPGGAKMLCIVNAQKSTVTFFNGQYCSSSIVTHEFLLHSHGSSVGRFATALHKLSAGKGAKISGLSCRLIESPRGSGNFALNVRLLYYNELGQISQITAWAQLRKWQSEEGKIEEVTVWAETVGMGYDNVLKLVEK
jgi:hypothetical protein